MSKFADDEPRPHHYVFAHRILAKLALKHGARMLEMAKEASLMPALERTWDDAGRNVPPKDRLSRDGLEASLHRLRAADLILITLPPASHAPEAHFAGIAIAVPDAQPPSIRYFVLEFGWEPNDEPRTVFCEWTPENHLNMGNGPPVEASAFIAAIADVLDHGPRLHASVRLP